MLTMIFFVIRTLSKKKKKETENYQRSVTKIGNDFFFFLFYWSLFSLSRKIQKSWFYHQEKKNKKETIPNGWLSLIFGYPKMTAVVVPPHPLFSHPSPMKLNPYRTHLIYEATLPPFRHKTRSLTQKWRPI